MPLETILKALDAEAERQEAEIRQAAQAKIAKIQADARQQAEAVHQKHLDAIRPPLKREQARVRNQAQQRALQMVLGTREVALSDVLEATAQRLAHFSESEIYREFMAQLAMQAAEVLGRDQPLSFRVKQADVPLMKQVVQSLGLMASVQADIEGEDTVWNGGLGGLIALTADERISVVNTLEMRLQQVASIYRSQIADWVFGPPSEG